MTTPIIKEEVLVIVFGCFSLKSIMSVYHPAKISMVPIPMEMRLRRRTSPNRSLCIPAPPNAGLIKRKNITSKQGMMISIKDPRSTCFKGASRMVFIFLSVGVSSMISP